MSAFTALLLAVTLQSLGRPITARNILAGLVTVNPRDGREVLVLTNNNEFSGAELIFIDIESGAATVVRAPAGAGIEGLTEVPGHRLALGTFYDGTLMLFDMRTMQYVQSSRFEQETYLWGFAMGSDGRAYFGSYPGGKLGALDLSTYSVEDLGAPVPPNFYLRAVFPTADGRILCHFIFEKPTWLIFDPVSKTFERASDEFQGRGVAAVWDKYIVSGQTAFEGRDLHPAVQSPFPIPANATAEDFGVRQSPSRSRKPIEWAVDTQSTTPKALFISQGDGLWVYHKGDQKLTLVTSGSLRGARILGETRDGRLAGVRGQDYFLMRPGDTRLTLKTIPGTPSPRSITFLRFDSRGRLWAGPPFGSTLCTIDPNTKAATNTPNISDFGGEVYDVAFANGLTYAAAYSAGEVIRYDPDKPWDEWGQTNPRTLARIGPEFIRPTGGIIVGPGGKLYSGWTAGTGYGGAIAITDPQTGATQLMREPLGQQQIMGVATDGTLLYAGTGLSGTGLPDQEGPARFGIIDPISGNVVAQYDVDGSNRIRVIGYDALTRIVVTIIDARIRLFDTKQRVFLGARTGGSPPVASWSNAIPGDGKLYYGSGMQVLALDLATGLITTVADAPGYVNNVAMGPDGTIYFGIGAELYAVR